MKKVTSFDKQNLNELRKEMNELLSKYGASINLNFEVGNMKFLAGEVEIKVTAKVVGGKDKFAEALELKLNSLISPPGTTDFKLLKEFVTIKNDRGDELVGYNSKKYSKPFLFKSGLDGKTYVCDERYVLHYFKKKA
jgi:hypothetical protein